MMMVIIITTATYSRKYECKSAIDSALELAGAGNFRAS
jgi:hypothetical protein